MLLINVWYCSLFIDVCTRTKHGLAVSAVSFFTTFRSFHTIFLLVDCIIAEISQNMSVYSSVDNHFLPNLPGFRAKELNTGPKKQHFTLVNGQVFLRDECLPAIGNGDGDDSSVMTFGSQSMTKTKRNIATENLILTFQAYFEERPDNSHAKSSQIRKCNVYFYLEDGTIKIVEKPQLNSGVSQGTLVSRTVIMRSDGTPVIPEDIRLGEELVVYGRHYK